MKLRLRSALHNLLHKDEIEKDLDAEVRAFVNMVADEKIATGVPQAEAQRGALAECGGIERVKQSVRDGRSGVAFENFWQDLGFGIRHLRRNPIFAIATILTLGIGIGANTAIFTFVNSVLLRPFPYPDSNRLTIILSELGNSSRAPASMFELYQMRQRSHQFDQIAGIWVTNRALPGKGDPEQGKAGVVTSNFLQLFCFSRYDSQDLASLCLVRCALFSESTVANAICGTVYSVRKASIGSVEAARRAGHQDANKPVITSSVQAAASVIGSRGVTPKMRLRNTCVPASDAAIPATSPIPT